MANDVFGFLGKEVDDALPEGAGVFENTGFIGQTLAKLFWQFWSEEDLGLYESGYQKGEDYRSRGQTGSYFYYFEDREKADDAAELLEAYSPRRVWMFEVVTSSVKNFRNEQALEAFGQSISLDCRVTTIASSKYRHEYHMVTLPSLVDALARSAGFIDESIWHIRELLQGVEDSAFTERLQYRLIGDPQANDDDLDYMRQILDACDGNIELAHDVALGVAEVVPETVENLAGEVPIHYKYSKLWRRRAALWRALGEENTEAYIPEGKAQTDWGEDYTTDVSKLVACLNVSIKEWKEPLWARFHMLKDPRYDATYDSGSKRLSLPMISEIFPDEAAAAKAAEAEGASSGGSSKSKPEPKGDYPDVPEAWGEQHRDDWMEILADKKTEYDGVPSMPELIKLGEQLSATADDLKAWWELV